MVRMLEDSRHKWAFFACGSGALVEPRRAERRRVTVGELIVVEVRAKRALELDSQNMYRITLSDETASGCTLGCYPTCPRTDNEDAPTDSDRNYPHMDQIRR